jgi:uncharacterized protein
VNDFSLLIKPSAADCNLRCPYCFYIGKLRFLPPRPRMADEVLEKMIASYLTTRQVASYTFSWQGGEPGLMGLRFFRRAVALQRKHAPRGAVICNAFQTNATLVSDELAEFFAEYKFLVGVSLDGPAQLHDHYRRTRDGQPTHATVRKNIERLRRHGVDFNVLTVVSDRTVKQPREIYGYLKNLGHFHQQYIPCVEFDSAGRLRPYAITGRDWGAFLCEIFDRWYAEDRDTISIRLFDSVVEYLVRGKYNTCTMGTDCRVYFVVEYDGSVYPCDFFVTDAMKLGNIMDGAWPDFLASPIFSDFGVAKSAWHEDCQSCAFLKLCHGDCQKFRPPRGQARNSSAKSVLCDGWLAFYAHTLPRFEQLAAELKQREPAASVASRELVQIRF